MERACKNILSALLVVCMMFGLVLGGVFAEMAKEKITVSELKVNNLVEPLGVDTTPQISLAEHL